MLNIDPIVTPQANTPAFKSKATCEKLAKQKLSRLTEQSKADMERLAVEMRKFPDAKYEIAGYADARGSDAYNDRLSERRAKAVKEALIEKGFKAENLTIIGKGKRFLHVRDAQTDDQHAQNRRVEVRIINTENK